LLNFIPASIQLVTCGMLSCRGLKNVGAADVALAACHIVHGHGASWFVE
jgi:hypothetical protein